MADKYRAKRYRPEVDPNNYAAIAAALSNERQRSRTCGPGYEEIDAPTKQTGPNARPRAKKCCYNQNTKTLIIVMTDPGPNNMPKYTWIEYADVEDFLWEGLKDAQSTNEFVQEALLNHPYTVTQAGSLPRTREEAFTSEVKANEEYYGRYGDEGAPIPNY
jgi:hypothetical protein